MILLNKSNKHFSNKVYKILISLPIKVLRNIINLLYKLNIISNNPNQDLTFKLSRAFNSEYLLTLNTSLQKYGSTFFKKFNIIDILWEFDYDKSIMNTKKGFFLGSYGLIILFDYNNFESLKDLEKYIEKAKQENGREEFPLMILYGIRIPKKINDQKEVHKKDIEQLRLNLNRKYKLFLPLLDENFDAEFVVNLLNFLIILQKEYGKKIINNESFLDQFHSMQATIDFDEFVRQTQKFINSLEKN